MTQISDNAKIEYNKIQVPFADGAAPQYINSAFTTSQNYAVQNGNSLGNKLASGDVGSVENIEEINESENIEALKSNKTGEDSNPLFLTDSDIKDIEQAIVKQFNCYDKEIQNQILEEYDCADIYQIMEKVNVKGILSKIENGMDAESKGLKELLGDNYNKENVSRIFSKEYFIKTLPNIVLFWTNLDPTGHYLDNLNNAASETNILSDDFQKIYHEKELDCRYDIFNNAKNTTDLSKKLGVDNIDNLKPEEQAELINKYFEKVIDDYQKASLEEKRNIIYEELAPFVAWAKSNNVDPAVKNALNNIAAKMNADALKVILESAENNDEKVEILKGITVETLSKCPPETLEFLVQQFEEGGILYEYVKDKGINPDKLREIFAKCKTEEDFENLSAEEKELLNSATEVIQVAINIFEGVIQNKNISDEDKTRMGGKVGDFIGTEMGEDSYREWIEDIHNWYQENGGNLNLTPEQFEEIMNGATHNNYQIVAEGSSEPLDMSFAGNSSNTSSANNGNNPEYIPLGSLGFSPKYTEQPKITIDKSNFYTDENNQNKITLIKPGESIDSVISKSSDNNRFENLKNYKRSVGTISFVSDVLNSTIARRCTYAVNMALTSFENMGRSLRRLTFERIHNSSSAILAADRMSVQELDDVHAQNIYVAENITQIKEEKEKEENIKPKLDNEVSLT